MLELSFDEPNRFGPSRAAVMSSKGMVVTSQPLAALTGVSILRQGGNAFDAAIATAAMLNVIEPMSTGVGGDVFALFYEAKTGQIRGLNGSGRSPHEASIEEYQRRFGNVETHSIPTESMLAVTVPGTVDGWSKILERYGRMSISEVLAPAIETAEEGFAVAPQTALFWDAFKGPISQHPDSQSTWFYPDGHTPRPGEIFKNPKLGRTLRLIAEGGSEVFYRGELADSLVRFSETNGGLFTKKDFEDHKSTWVDPISVRYRDYEVLELPPNGQGIAVLEALNILSQGDFSSLIYGSEETIHFQLEALKLALHDARSYVTDPEKAEIPIDQLLSDGYAKKSFASLEPDRVIDQPAAGLKGGDTVYLCVADREGNVVSLINSIFMPWGSGLTAGDTGIVLQNRGSMFSLDVNHCNVIASHKRTRHTILPAMVCCEGMPLIAFGCVGGEVQPQGQLQFLCNVIDFGMNLQDALDAPRWRYDEGTQIALEAGITGTTRSGLEKKGHHIGGVEGFFGGGQALLIHPEHGTFQGGSDPRRDGCAIGY